VSPQQLIIDSQTGEMMEPIELAEFIRETIIDGVNHNEFVTPYREPIIGFVAAADPGFANLSKLTAYDHLMPEDLLLGARSVICYYLPFATEIAYANAQEKEQVAREWAVAYQETNSLIGEIAKQLIDGLKQYGVHAAAEPATGNFKESDLRSHWSHKSIAVLAGIGSFGLHQLVITDAGCTGRFGSVVIDAKLPIDKPERKEHCEYYELGTCLDCVFGCPVNAISEDEPFNRRACWTQCIKNSKDFLDLGGDVKVCGKCAVVGPCALASAT
jgi:epoxyqueuosine reductase QueG